jgi:secreted trypsin-like serine protease
VVCEFNPSSTWSFRRAPLRRRVLHGIEFLKGDSMPFFSRRLLACALLLGCTPSVEKSIERRASEIINGSTVREPDMDRYPFWAATAGWVNYYTPDGSYAWDYDCGAVLVAPDWVLSAGHCAYVYDDKGNRTPIPARERWVVMGQRDRREVQQLLREMERTGEIPDDDDFYAVDRIIVHPRYVETAGGEAGRYDVSLWKLTRRTNRRPVPFVMTPAEEATAAPTRTLVRALGWGNTRQDEEDPEYARFLQQVDVPVADRAQCAAALAHYYGTTEELVGPDVLCAGGGEKDACGGDSGGPLLARRGSGYVLVGITSFGPAPCAEPGVPGGYAALGGVGDWVRRCIDDPGCGLLDER